MKKNRLWGKIRKSRQSHLGTSIDLTTTEQQNNLSIITNMKTHEGISSNPLGILTTSVLATNTNNSMAKPKLVYVLIRSARPPPPINWNLLW